MEGEVIAIARDETRAVGVMSLAPKGYIDFAFIRPEDQGTGLFRRLIDMTESKIRSQNEPRLWNHASLMAERAFAAVGFAVVDRELVEMGGESLSRVRYGKNDWNFPTVLGSVCNRLSQSWLTTSALALSPLYLFICQQGRFDHAERA